MNNPELTPSPELVESWEAAWRSDHHPGNGYSPITEYIAVRAAQYGADRELEACCQWLTTGGIAPSLPAMADALRATRRPAPPSIKQQALAELETLQDDINAHGLGFTIKHGAIRKALEMLDD